MKRLGKWILVLLLLELALAFAFGTALRRELEGPRTYLGAMPRDDASRPV